MAGKPILQKELFLDTAYAIALAAPGDDHHDQAIALADSLEAQGTRIVTTRAITIEIGNALARLRYRQAAIELLDSLDQDPSVEIVPISGELYHRAFQLYRDRRDKERGITDCISFVVMRERSIACALTTDEHFQQAGFEALLL
jgi:hypothetical protein